VIGRELKPFGARTDIGTRLNWSWNHLMLKIIHYIIWKIRTSISIIFWFDNLIAKLTQYISIEK
jgi:hypothetical protein